MTNNKLPHTIITLLKKDYKDNNMSTDRENGRGNKRASVTRARQKEALHCAQT
jgi:hypothetical protein